MVEGDASFDTPQRASLEQSIPQQAMAPLGTEPKPVEKPKKPEDKRKTVTIRREALNPEIQAMVGWALKAREVPAAGINVDKAWKINLWKSNYALISKGDTPMRIIPFGWAEDPKTRELWAIFDKNLFVGKPAAGMFNVSTWTLMIPFDKGPDMCDYAGARYFARFDEVSERQSSLFHKDLLKDQLQRIEDKLADSELEQLRSLLLSQTTKKTNWRGIIKMIIVIGVVGFIGYWFVTNPSWFSSLQHLI